MQKIRFILEVKQSLQSPEQALSIPGVGGSQISRQSAHESGKVPAASPPLPPPRIFLILISINIFFQYINYLSNYSNIFRTIEHFQGYYSTQQDDTPDHYIPSQQSGQESKGDKYI